MFRPRPQRILDGINKKSDIEAETNKSEQKKARWKLQYEGYVS